MKRRWVRAVAVIGASAAVWLAIGSGCDRGDFDDAAETYCRDGTDWPCTAPESPDGSNVGQTKDAGADAGKDGGLDAGLDAGPGDAGPADAGAPDAGACASGCGGGQECIDGGCACPGDRPDDCSGVCTDITTDPGNCGGCGAACAPGDLCVASTCTTRFDAGTYNVAFVTHGTVIPGLLGGVLGGDAVCQATAADAGLPGTYVALLGTTGFSPWARLSGYRGWVRTDLKPFGDAFSSSSQSPMFYPLRFDESGKDVGDVRVATGANLGGPQYTCGEWTDPDGGIYTPGYSAQGGANATYSYPQVGCDKPAHLYCFEVDKNAPLVLPVPTARRLFLSTSATIDGGIAQADGFCQQQAASAGLQGTFLAVLATSTTAAADRFDAGTWYLMDGVTVTGFLTPQGPDTPIVVTADGGYDMNSAVVETGATSPGAKASANCANWTQLQNAGPVEIGGSPYTGPKSFFNIQSLCATYARFYCAEP